MAWTPTDLQTRLDFALRVAREAQVLILRAPIDGEVAMLPAPVVDALPEGGVRDPPFPDSRSCRQSR